MSITACLSTPNPWPVDYRVWAPSSPLLGPCRGSLALLPDLQPSDGWQKWDRGRISTLHPPLGLSLGVCWLTVSWAVLGSGWGLGHGLEAKGPVQGRNGWGNGVGSLMTPRPGAFQGMSPGCHHCPCHLVLQMRDQFQNRAHELSEEAWSLRGGSEGRVREGVGRHLGSAVSPRAQTALRKVILEGAPSPC